MYFVGQWGKGAKTCKLNVRTLEKDFNIRNKVASVFFSPKLLPKFCSQLVENLIDTTFVHSVKPVLTSQASERYGVIYYVLL